MNAAPQPTDLGDGGTVYKVALTGAQIDVLVNALDQAVRAGGIANALVALPVLDALTATRKAALTKKSRR